MRLAKLKAARTARGKFIAGGHSLVPLMKLRLSEPQVLIDIARIPDLAGIRERDGKIAIGAGTVHHDVATSSLLRERCPVVAEAAATIGDPQVRNRGTIGGSVAHADPSADYPGRAAGARRGDPPEGAEGLARREGRRLLRGSVHRGPCRRRDHRQRPVRPGADRRLRQAPSARVALRHRRRRGGARGERRKDRIGARRPDWSDIPRPPADQGRTGARGSGDVDTAPWRVRRRWPDRN